MMLAGNITLFSGTSKIASTLSAGTCAIFCRVASYRLLSLLDANIFILHSLQRQGLQQSRSQSRAIGYFPSALLHHESLLVFSL
jgi:hypothetical protein